MYLVKLARQYLQGRISDMRITTSRFYRWYRAFQDKEMLEGEEISNRWGPNM